MNQEKNKIINLAMQISSKLQNAASQLHSVENSSEAFTLWQRENSTLDQLLTDLTDFNEGFKQELELMCGQELQFTEIVESTDAESTDAE
jgi:hypothetical protein